MKHATVRNIIGLVIGVVFLPAGVFLICIGPIAPWIIMGVMFCLAGLALLARPLIGSTAGGRTVLAILATATASAFGLCFLSAALLHPEDITSTLSINQTEVDRSEGSFVGVIVFALVGVVPLIFAHRIFHAVKNNLERQAG